MSQIFLLGASDEGVLELNPDDGVGAHLFGFHFGFFDKTVGHVFDPGESGIIHWKREEDRPLARVRLERQVRDGKEVHLDRGGIHRERFGVSTKRFSSSKTDTRINSIGFSWELFFL